MIQGRAQKVRVEVRVENTRKRKRKSEVIVGEVDLRLRARRHLHRRKEVGIVHLLAAAQDHRDGKSDIPGVGLALLVWTDLADR